MHTSSIIITIISSKMYRFYLSNSLNISCSLSVSFCRIISAHSVKVVHCEQGAFSLLSGTGDDVIDYPQFLTREYRVLKGGYQHSHTRVSQILYAA